MKPNKKMLKKYDQCQVAWSRMIANQKNPRAFKRPGSRKRSNIV